MSKELRIYHNPRCSKSRDALQYLQDQGLEPEVIHYLDTPPEEAEIEELLSKLGIAASSLIRAKEYGQLGLQATSDSKTLVRQMAENPSVIERPIVVSGENACIGRPIENLKRLLE